jgi:hypothetical protein
VFHSFPGAAIRCSGSGDAMLPRTTAHEDANPYCRPHKADEADEPNCTWKIEQADGNHDDDAYEREDRRRKEGRIASPVSLAFAHAALASWLSPKHSRRPSRKPASTIHTRRRSRADPGHVSHIAPILNRVDADLQALVAMIDAEVVWDHEHRQALHDGRGEAFGDQTYDDWADRHDKAVQCFVRLTGQPRRDAELAVAGLLNHATRLADAFPCSGRSRRVGAQL